MEAAEACEQSRSRARSRAASLRTRYCVWQQVLEHDPHVIRSGLHEVPAEPAGCQRRRTGQIRRASMRHYRMADQVRRPAISARAWVDRQVVAGHSDLFCGLSSENWASVKCFRGSR